jgi:hypothetical protein
LLLENQFGERSCALPADYFERSSPARVWDYWLGGENNYPVDRAVGDEYIRVYPEVLTIARASRQLLSRVVRHLAGPAGIRNYLDIGAGLPTVQNTHEVAQAVAPDSRVVYVDNDPLVLAHARTLLTNTTPEGITVCLDVDVHEPELIISDARNTLNFNQPVAVLLLGILGHAASTAGEMHRITKRLMAASPPGSYLVVGDGVRTGDRRFETAARNRGYHLRTMEEFRACFDGLELIEPGVVPCNLWRPERFEIGIGAGTVVEPLVSYVGVGRKPA